MDRPLSGHRRRQAGGAAAADPGAGGAAEFYLPAPAAVLTGDSRTVPPAAAGAERYLRATVAAPMLSIANDVCFS